MGKKDLRDFEVQFVHLKNGEHSFDFQIDPTFFSYFPDTLVEHGEGEAFLLLNKTETMLTLTFQISMILTLTCDVSLKEFEHPVSIDKRLMVKFGDVESEPDDEVIIIPRERMSLNVADFIHQYINLEIPMKKVHPDLKDVDRPDISFTTGSTEEESSKDVIDPRWEALKKLKE